MKVKCRVLEFVERRELEEQKSHIVNIVITNPAPSLHAFSLYPYRIPASRTSSLECGLERVRGDADEGTETS